MIKATTHFDWVTDPPVFPTGPYRRDGFSKSITQEIKADRFFENEQTRIRSITFTIIHKMEDVETKAILKSTAVAKFAIEHQDERISKDFLIGLLQEGYDRFEDYLCTMLQDTIYYPDLCLPEFDENQLMPQIEKVLSGQG